MSSFITNSQMYNVVTESELAEVLSHYDSEFVYNIVDEALKSRFQCVPVTPIPNVVAGWESNFKAIIANYGNMEAHAQVINVRNETYREIIDTICKEFNLNFTIDDSVDLYSSAYHLYDFFVSNFSNNMISLFANFIYKERSSLYDILNLSEMKKNKDGSTIYGKKIYKDVKLAVINANIDTVIKAVCDTDIPFHSIISLICGNNSELKTYFLSIVSANQDFLNTAYVPVLNSDIQAEIITGIRFKLQQIAISHDQAMTSSEIFTTQDPEINTNTEETNKE